MKIKTEKGNLKSESERGIENIRKTSGEKKKQKMEVKSKKS